MAVAVTENMMKIMVCGGGNGNGGGGNGNGDGDGNSDGDGDVVGYEKYLTELIDFTLCITNTLMYEMSASSKASMINAALRMVQCNTVVHTIDLPSHANDEELFQNSIVPRLEMNRTCFEHQRQALTRVNHTIPGQLLGRALHVVRKNPDLLFRFLTENVPAFVRSDVDGPIVPTE
jgi:hypothetical protein